MIGTNINNMSLEKAIKHKKEKRKEYHGPEAVDKSCRPHGGCPVCEGNRKHASDVKKLACEQMLEEDFYGDGKQIGRAHV